MASNCTRCKMPTRPMTGGRICLYCESDQTRQFVLSHPTTRAEFLRATLSDPQALTSLRVRSMLLLRNSPRVRRVDTVLLRQALERIERDPSAHDQTHWAVRRSCGTAFCLAGHALDLRGMRFDWSSDRPFGSGETDKKVAEMVIDDRGRRVPVNLTAANELGLLSADATYLFDAFRSFEEMSLYAGRLIAFQQTLDSLPERNRPFRPKPGHPVHRRWQFRSGRDRSLRMSPLSIADIVARLGDATVDRLPGLTREESEWLRSPDGNVQDLMRAELVRS